MKQLTLPLFDTEKVEQSFEVHGTSKTYITCSLFGIKTGTGGHTDYYIRRGKKGVIEKGNKEPNKEDYTFIHISSLNLLGKRSGTLFRFMNKESSFHKMAEDVIMPELQNLSKERLIEFVEHIIWRYENREFDWNYESRCRMYNCSFFPVV